MVMVFKKTGILTLILGVVALLAQGAFAQNNDSEQDQSDIQKRIHAAAGVLEELMGTPDSQIPDSVLEGAQCIIVIPSEIRIAIGFGGRHGKGVATCYNRNGWSAPAPVTLTGGSWGLQIGAEAVDLVMVVMDKKGAESLLASKFKIGAGLSAAAGPVGRQTSAGTNWKFKSKILTYSRARGVFAGINLNGTVIAQDRDETHLLYGKMVPFQKILSGKVTAPKGSDGFEAAVERYATQARRRNGSNPGTPGTD